MIKDLGPFSKYLMAFFAFLSLRTVSSAVYFLITLFECLIFAGCLVYYFCCGQVPEKHQLREDLGFEGT